MGSSLNLSLTDELRAFVDKNSGDGTLYATASEYVRDLIRHKKRESEAEKLREGILEGYQDIAAGRVTECKGDLEALLNDEER